MVIEKVKVPEAIYHCQLDQKFGGVHKTRRGKAYQPSWPRGLPENWRAEIMRDMIQAGINAIDRYHELTQDDLYSTDVFRLPNGMIRVVLQDKNPAELF